MVSYQYGGELCDWPCSLSLRVRHMGGHARRDPLGPLRGQYWPSPGAAAAWQLSLSSLHHAARTLGHETDTIPAILFPTSLSAPSPLLITLALTLAGHEWWRVPAPQPVEGIMPPMPP